MSTGSARNISVGPKFSIQEVNEFKSKGWEERAITTDTAEYFGVKVSFDSDGVKKEMFFPYGPHGYKARNMREKNFYTVGNADGIFGYDTFKGQRGGKRLVITSGDLDLLAYAEACQWRYKRYYPVITTGSDKHVERLIEIREWIRSFDEVVLAFDKDSAGERAEKEALRIVGMDKAKIAEFDHNDLNDVLVNGSKKELMEAVFNAVPYVPGGILSKDELWQKLEEFNQIQSIPFPPCMAGVNVKTKGKRYGDITLFISGTGSGKSTLIREDVLHTLDVTKDKIGFLAFEEGPAETARKMAGMAIMKNPANEELSLEELEPGFEKVFGEDRVMVLDHQGSMTDESVIDKLEYMCLKGCKHIYIDHITLLVSEGVEGLIGNEAQDKMMGDLLRLVKRYPVWIGLVSHLRKTPSSEKSFEEGKLPTMDDIRGSGSVKQISMDIVAFARNMRAKNEKVRNTIKMEVLKCRFTGLTGLAESAVYNFETGRLEHFSGSFEEVETDE